MRNTGWSVALTALLVCACSQISKKQTLATYPLPPLGNIQQGQSTDAEFDLLLEDKLKNHPQDEARLLIRYLQAKALSDSDQSKACRYWLEVSSGKDFPLAHVARLRAVEVCPSETTELPSAELLMGTTQEIWLSDLLLRTALQRSIATKDKAWEMILSLQLAKKEKLQTKRILLLERARDLAKELNDSQNFEIAQAELYTVAPRLNPNPSPDLFISVAADLRKNREFEKSRSFYRRAIALRETSDADRLKALDGIRMTFKLENNKEKFILATREYATFARKKFFLSPPQQLHRHLEAQITLARAIWTENQPVEAKKILSKVEAELRGKFPVDESLYVRARIEEEAGDFAGTVKILDEIDAGKITNRDLRAKILWHRAWNLRKAKRLPESIAILENLVSAESTPSLLGRNRYWLARTYQDNGDTEKSLAEYEWLIANDPLGYYGTLAYRELKRPLPPLKVNQDASVSDFASSAFAIFAQEELFEREEKIIFEWLLATSELELARKFIDQIMQQKKPTPGSVASLKALKSYARAGSYQALFARVQDFPPEVRAKILEKNPELIFPQPWRELVLEASRKYDVPIELVYSIIRQESSFDPMARSHADAFGLMQMIPEMAEKAHETTGIAIKSPEDLYSPQINIPLGTAFLKGLLNKWHGHFIPAVASYNASEKAVSGWLQTRDRSDPVAFIEDVPYEETRSYLKLVLRNLVFYSRLNSDGKPVDFPERCLDALQDVKP